MISCLWSFSYSSLKSFCSAYATHHGGTWYGLLSSFTCNENVPTKHLMPTNTSSNSFCICFVMLALVLLSFCLFGPGRKYSISLYASFVMGSLFVIPESNQLHYLLPLVTRCYMAYCLNLNCCLCLCRSLHCCPSHCTPFPGLCFHSTAHFPHWWHSFCSHCNLLLSALSLYLLCCS